MDSVSPYVLIPFIAFVVNLILTVYIVARRREGEVYIAYFLFSLSLTCWALIDFGLWTHVFDGYYTPILKIGAIFWHAAPFAFLNFVYTFIKRRRDKLYWLFAYTVAATLVLTITTDLVITGPRLLSIAVIDYPGPLHNLVSSVSGTLPFLTGLVLLFRAMRNSRDVSRRRLMAMIIGGTLFGLCLTLLTMIIIPDVLMNESILPMQDIAFLMNSIVIFIAIRRFNFLELRVADIADDLFSRMRDGIILLESNGDIKHINYAAIKMLGLSSEELKNKNFSLGQFFDNVEDDRDEFSHQEFHFGEGNEKRFFDVSKTLAMKVNGKYAGIITIRDITHHKQHELELMLMNRALEQTRDKALKANQMKSQFLANMSHELRTPLNAVIGYSELISEDAGGIEMTNIVDDANRINAAGKHLLSLINDILDLSKIEAGKMQPYIEKFNINVLVEDITALVKPMIDKNNNELLVEDISEELYMDSDHTKVRQIIFNFLSNAGKFTKHGQIKFTISLPDQHSIRFSVEDNGIGIKQSKLSQLFDAFTQADASTTRKYGGTGLGLAICKRYAEMLGGELDVKTEEGVGSEFSVCLPLSYYNKHEK
ncbi:MAG: ATP-binding protein [Gammaproteobacteria bacterium]|nr:ATP-binding protein [Gammaproteobacteria bacterium]